MAVENIDDGENLAQEYWAEHDRVNLFCLENSAEFYPDLYSGYLDNPTAQPLMLVFSEKFVPAVETLGKEVRRLLSSSEDAYIYMTDSRLQEFVRPIVEVAVDLLQAGKGNPVVMASILNELLGGRDQSERRSSQENRGLIMNEMVFLMDVASLMAFKAAKGKEKGLKKEAPAVELPAEGAGMAGKVEAVATEITG